MFANSTVKAAALAALMALSLLPAAASAATSCSLATGNVVFGSYDVFSPASLDTSATLIVTCSRAGGPQHVSITIAISPGTHGGSTANRTMKASGGDLLGYKLFRDAARAATWGEVPGLDTFTQMLSVPNHSSAQATVTIFGRIPAGQNVAQGSYSDSIMVTVTP